MKNYDFLILQHNEFECLARDLLQKKERIFIESFTIGKDGGIDLRFAPIKGKKAIVQAKRYRTYSELLSNLKKEVSKVAAMSLDRYIVCTSVGLTPGNKDEIKQLFHPHIISTEDIIGRDDLNNLLGLYPEIEKQYYKLWLGSTDVLDSLINNRINNWSEFRLEKIREDIYKYVMNDSFGKAVEILDNHRYVIISGIPGIGKSTLANMLVYKYLADGYEEFVYITGNIDDILQKYQKGKKQIFMFDDFLGSTVFEKGEQGFDSKLLSIIETISKSSDKLFVLTTREYILSQAKEEYEKLSLSNIDISKCTIDFKDYNKAIRAKILYNHLAGADIPLEYLHEIISQKRYKQIVDHQNFNPRIIETIVNQRLWEQVHVNEFFPKIMEMFNKPVVVWDFPFRKLDSYARYALLVLRTLGGSVLLDDWKEAFISFLQNNFYLLHMTFDEDKWNSALKVLSDCFICIDMYGGSHKVSFHNPSVPEFLETHLKDRKEMQKMLLSGAIYEEQTYTLFNDSHLNDMSESDIVDMCDRCLSSHKTAKLLPQYAVNGHGLKPQPNRIRFLTELATKHKNVLGRLNYVESALTLADLKTEHMFNIIHNLATNIDLSKTDISAKDIIDHMIASVKWLYHYPDMLKFIEMHDKISEYSDRLAEDIEDIVLNSELDYCRRISDIEDIEGHLKRVIDFLPDKDFSDLYEAIEAKRKELKNQEEDDSENDSLIPEIQNNDISESELEELFTSLLVK